MHFDKKSNKKINKKNFTRIGCVCVKVVPKWLVCISEVYYDNSRGVPIVIIQVNVTLITLNRLHPRFRDWPQTKLGLHNALI